MIFEMSELGKCLVMVPAKTLLLIVLNSLIDYLDFLYLILSSMLKIVGEFKSSNWDLTSLK